MGQIERRTDGQADEKNIIEMRYNRWSALENWQASCQFNLAHELKEN